MVRNNLKKYLAGLLAAALMFAAVSVPVQAETDKDAVMNEEGSFAEINDSKEKNTMYKNCEIVSENNLTYDSETLIQYLEEEPEVYNYLKVAGVSVNKSNADDILSDGTASYDLETNTLTLENADIYMEKASKNYPVYAKGNLNIVLKGENKLSSDYYYGIAIVDPANADSISVTISGDGSLDSYGSDGGIFVKGSLTIDGDVTVNGKCGEVTSGSAYGIRVNKDFVISGNADVTAKAGSAPENSYGAYAGDNFTVCGDAYVNTEGGKGIERSAGLYAISNIYIKDNAQVTTLGAVNNEPEKFASESYGIRTTHIYVSGGTLTTTGQGATISGLSAGIYAQDFELTGGTVNANSVEAGDALSIGIQSTKTLKIINGTLNATSGDTTTDSYAVEASGGIDVSGGVVNAVTGHADNAHGIDADKVNITGGDVNVYNEGAISQARGIRSNNEIIISSGNVKVEVGDAQERVYGIQAGAPVTITGGKVLVDTGNTEKSSAIYGWGDITIADSEVDIISKGDGIYAPDGNVNVSCTDKTTKVTVDANGYGVYGQNGISISDNLVIDVPENGTIVQVQTEDGENYSYISAENESIAEKVTIVPIGSEDTQKPGDTEEPDNVENPEDTKTPASEEKSPSVQTGDNTQVGLWMVLSITMLAVIVILRKRNYLNSK